MRLTAPGWMLVAGLVANLAAARFVPAVRAAALWDAPPTRAQAGRFARGADSARVWSIDPADAASAGRLHGLEQVRAGRVRASALLPAGRARDLARLLFANQDPFEICDCRLVRGARDTDSAVVALACFHVGKDVMWAPISWRDDCAALFFAQGIGEDVPVGSTRGEIWRLLREALGSDPCFSDSVPPRAATPGAYPGPKARVPGAATKDSVYFPYSDAGERTRVDRLPIATLRVAPGYPEAALAMHVTGTVLLWALVGREGLVRDVFVRWSIPGLDEAALTAVRQFQFLPALRDGNPVAVWVEVPVRFTRE